MHELRCPQIAVSGRRVFRLFFASCLLAVLLSCLLLFFTDFSRCCCPTMLLIRHWASALKVRLPCLAPVP